VTIADEAGLLARLRAGEPAAYAELVAALTGRLTAVARRYLSEAEAQDAVQDAFISAFKSIGRFQGQASLATWLHRITVNACLMRLRSARRRPERAIDDLLPQFQPDGHAREVPGSWTPPERSGIEAEEQRRMVRRCIEELPEAYRVVLLLRDIEGLSTEAAAAALGTTPNAVKIRLHRARQALRELLDPRMRGDRP
jgi:RNA polymerase sigma-70 factor (ECF subfamily)